MLNDPVTPALIVHITAGSLAILSGAAALSVRKGERLHRVFGTVFLLSILTMSTMGAYLAVLIPQKATAVVGLFTFYFVATAWMTVKRKEGTTGLFEVGAFVIVTGTTHSFDSFEDVVREVDNARIFGGMHFRHSVKEGNRLGRMVTEYVLKTHFRVKDEQEDD
jgi:uncharacterized membrane protein